jgi:predicted lipoprotein with Yx(FWY)xxD motif
MTTITNRRAAAAAGLISLGLLVAACGSSSSSTPPAAGSSTSPATSAGSSSAAPSSAAAAGQAQLKTTHASLGTVLTDAKGFALYWFAPDTSTSSKCDGACAAAWPPVIGTPAAASSVTLPGKLGTITRSDGSTQATYNGHPLYTFKGDSAAGQVNGNGVNGFGGLWYAVTASGSAGATPSASSGGGGYGY